MIARAHLIFGPPLDLMAGVVRMCLDLPHFAATDDNCVPIAADAIRNPLGWHRCCGHLRSYATPTVRHSAACIVAHDFSVTIDALTCRVITVLLRGTPHFGWTR